ncbi:ATP-grasp domain-containing protein [Streptomyces sp. HD]|uniref:ATP-grasp domain-containing protein n=1 Tax=Streptomyces sp. HD TaxID=3020892 RepID=UPI0023314F18|nr:ATP-grasp domain-containing protein [Streptomyces sp. HD]MDC0770837.1 ATP-grasp domain-containing protein [Streptomyces sp. HD]
MDANVLLLHVMKNVLPERIHNAEELGRLTVITEPGHVQQYGPDVDVHLVESVQNLEVMRAKVLEILRERRIDRIFAPFELGQSAAGYLRSYFGLPGTGLDVANNFSNKYVMKQRLAAGGLPVTDFRLAAGLHQVPEAADRLGWPVVIKPVIGGGSINVSVIDGPEHFEEFCRTPAAERLRALPVPLLAERFVRMSAEYHFDAVVENGQVLFSVGSRYSSPVLARDSFLGSCILPPDDPTRQRMTDMHAQAVSSLGLDSGVTHMEFFEMPDGLLAGEIACRPAGGSFPECIRMHTGVDLWRACLEVSLGLSPKLELKAEEGVLAHCHLPVSPGRIVEQTSEEELAALPSVVRVDMLRRKGDVVPAHLNSASASAVVYVRGDSPEEAEAAMRRVVEAYKIEIVPEDS